MHSDYTFMKSKIIIYFSLLALLMSSCGKDVTDVEGKWRLSTRPITGYDYYWEFTDIDDESGSVSILTQDTITQEVDTCSKGVYTVKNRVINIGAPVDFCEWHTFDGEWDIHKLDDEFLTVIRYLPRGTIYLEFIKE